MVSAQARREQASYAIERGLSERKACALLCISRTQMYYAHKMPVKDAPVITAMKSLSGLYPRFGSRRIRIFYSVMGLILAKNVVAACGLKQACKCLKSAAEGVLARR